MAISALLPLTKLPEWSDFFRVAMLESRLHFEWRERKDHWFCRAYDFSTDLSQPISVTTLSECQHADKFEALRLAMSASGYAISANTTKAFHHFRRAAGGQGVTLEGLL